MKTFTCPNEDFIKSEITKITADVLAGNAISISVKNMNGFEADDYIIVGTEGNDQAEITGIISTTTPTGITANLKFAHKEGTKITRILFNKRRLYGCATADGTYTLIETKEIEVDNPIGTYFEYSGLDYTYFKATYYNDVSLKASDLADSVVLRADDSVHYCSVYDIREEAGFVGNQYISDGIIEARRLSAESEVKASVGAVYTLPLSASCELVGTITKLLAAGWLMWKEYGEEASGTDKDGIAKVKEARSMLKAIRGGNLKLLDENDVGLTTPATDVDGWPDSTTKDALASEAGGKVKFRISKKF